MAIKSGKIMRSGHVECTRDKGNAYELHVGLSERKTLDRVFGKWNVMESESMSRVANVL
jgi:hypothetical protein